MRIDVLPRIIILPFVVDPALVGMAAIDATGRVKNVDERVVEAMPRATVATGQIHFFNVGWELAAGELPSVAARLGLHLVDPHTLAAFNAANPGFAYTRPNTTEWVNEAGEPCYATFTRWLDNRTVYVGQIKVRGDHWWFAGVPIEEAA